MRAFDAKRGEGQNANDLGGPAQRRGKFDGPRKSYGVWGGGEDGGEGSHASWGFQVQAHTENAGSAPDLYEIELAPDGGFTTTRKTEDTIDV